MKYLLIVVIASCSIDHPSDLLACTTQADCDATRTCTGGFCIVANASCPAGCTSCDVMAKTCAVDSSGNGDVTCPAGYHCTITCGNNGCRNVNCSTAASCTIACSGLKSCDSVTCTGAACALTCSGMGSCANVDCRDACACDVTCTGASSCNNLRCPSGCGTTTSCSSQLATCSHC